MMDISDDKLKRALFYFEHSLLIFDARDSIVSSFTRHHSQLISSAFLNLWKSISVILGDPSKSIDKDYQKRYKKFGISLTYFSSKIEKITGWKSEFQFEEALKQTVQWYKENPSWWEPLVNERTLHPQPWKLDWK